MCIPVHMGEGGDEGEDCTARNGAQQEQTEMNM